MILKKISNIARFRKEVFFEFEKISKKDSILHRLLYETSQKTNVYFVGGFLRSIINKEPVRDLDIIINLSTDQIKLLLNHYQLKYIQNKLAGFKIELPSIMVDIWSIHNNWAFKEGLVSNYESDICKKIAQGTFFNYDSLTFDIRTQNFAVSLYNRCVELNEIDIIKKSSKYKNSNPGKLGNIFRAIYIRKKTGLCFSQNFADYALTILYGKKINTKDEIIEYMSNELKLHKRFINILSLGDIIEGVDYIHSIAKTRTQNLLF